MTVPQQICADYLSIVDSKAPGLVEGLYLVGSTALDDFRPGLSDVDFVAVTGLPVDPEVVRPVHAEVAQRHRRPFFDGLYVTWADLASDPRTVPPGVSVHEHRLDTAGRAERHPVTWHTLDQCGVAVRGPHAFDIWTDRDGLAESVRENLRTYWRRWHTAGSLPVSKAAAATLLDWGPVWVVLGVSRLHYTLATGRITSKTGAGVHARETFPERWHRIIDECLRIRRGEPGPSLYKSRRTRRRDAMDFLDQVINDSLA